MVRLISPTGEVVEVSRGYAERKCRADPAWDWIELDALTDAEVEQWWELALVDIVDAHNSLPLYEGMVQ